VFSEQLQYYPGDYSRTGNHLEQNLLSNTDFPVSYTGRLQGQVFRNLPSVLASNVGNGVWGYVYDAKQQLSQSRYAGMQYWDLYERGVVPAFSDALSEKNLQYDNNGNLKSLQRYDKAGALQDNFVYNYKSAGTLPTNQLASIPNHASYVYNALGQLIEEKDKEGITKYKVEYNVQGLTVAVRDKEDKVRVQFAYNESGQRIRKTGGGKTTFYVRDNSGNVLSIYEQQTVSSDFEQTEVPLYGSGRIGQFRPKDQSYVYELRDHLGSVRAVILRRTKVGGGVDVLSYSDYYVLGGSVNGGGVPYRHGYQGQYSEKDPETGWDSFELRMYDSKIGRWMTVDPKGQYPSPYVGMGNDWGNRVDPDGGDDGQAGANRSKIQDIASYGPVFQSRANGNIFLDEVTVKPWSLSEEFANFFPKEGDQVLPQVQDFWGNVDHYLNGGRKYVASDGREWGTDYYGRLTAPSPMGGTPPDIMGFGKINAAITAETFLVKLANGAYRVRSGFTNVTTNSGKILSNTKILSKAEVEGAKYFTAIGKAKQPILSVGKGKVFNPESFEKPLSDVVNSQGPKSFWQKIKETIAIIGGQSF
jgi:RHS repeat-associated protein